jgi:hypothetical protein
MKFYNLRKLSKEVTNLENFLRTLYRKKSQESVYFYTFHKCASSLFSIYVLKHIEGLRHVDYANKIYRGKKYHSITFKPMGFIYGPIRLSANPASPVYKHLVEPTQDINFIRDKTAIFLVRDPRDIMVSAYYSFGYTHGLSPVAEIRAMQEQLRIKIQNKMIDEYVLEYSPTILRHFESVDRLSKECNRSVILRYEDMILNWDRFVEDLTKYVDIREAVLQQIYKKTRPIEREDKSSHRRSGKFGQFRDKLKTETITSINTTLESILERFQYAP